MLLKVSRTRFGAFVRLKEERTPVPLQNLAPGPRTSANSPPPSVLHVGIPFSPFPLRTPKLLFKASTLV